MYIGLDSGYCRFGTLAHRILLVALEYGKVSNIWLVEHFPRLKNAKQSIAVSLRRLNENGFLYKIDRGREPGGRIYTIYGLNPRKGLYQARVLTSSERCRAYRQRRSKAVSSVFEWRGPSSGSNISGG